MPDEGTSPEGPQPEVPPTKVPHPAPRRFGFARRRRLTRGADLDRVRREGKRVRTEHLEVRAAASLPRAGEGGQTRDEPRVGIIVPRYKHSAVERNRLKRRLRELARTQLLPVLAGGPAVDVVIRVRAEAYGASFDHLSRQVERVASALRRTVGDRPVPGAE